MIEIHKSLINFRDIYHPELLFTKKIIEPDSKAKGEDVITVEEGKNKKMKFEREEVLKICTTLCECIKNGNLEDASLNVRKLAAYKLNVKITLDEDDGTNAEGKKIEIINGLFDVQCVLLKEDETERKNIFLESLNLNMKIFDLKIKVELRIICLKLFIKVFDFIFRFIMNTKFCLLIRIG